MPLSSAGSMLERMADGVDLYWLPLGAGGRFVRFNGLVYERLVRHSPCDLYHAALEVTLAGGRTVVEMAPVWNAGAGEHGGVVTGAVGHELLGRFRLFRYEVRCWRGGVIPDVAEAVDSPQRLSSDRAAAQRVLDLCAEAPPYVWHRERWNSNSLVAWLLVTSGIGVDGVRMPANSRAPGWDAGLYVSSNPAIRRRATRMPSTPIVSK